MSNYYQYALIRRHNLAVKEHKLNYLEAQRFIEFEDGAYRYFKAICNSLDDEHFANELYQTYLKNGDPIHLATFGPDNIEIKCLPEEYPSFIMASASQIIHQIYNDFTRFYYRIETGPFANWYLRPTTTWSLFRKRTTHFTLDKISRYWGFDMCFLF